MRICPLGQNREIEIPADWAEELNLASSVYLEKTAEGILIRPICPETWDEIFATRLKPDTQVSQEEDLEIRGDDLFL